MDVEEEKTDDGDSATLCMPAVVKIQKKNTFFAVLVKE